MAELAFTRGKFRDGLAVNAFSKAVTFSPFRTRFMMATICGAAAGPVAALKRVSRRRRSKLMRGKQPVMIIFLFFGVRFIVLITRFSVGPFTAHVL